MAYSNRGAHIHWLSKMSHSNIIPNGKWEIVLKTFRIKKSSFYFKNNSHIWKNKIKWGFHQLEFSSSTTEVEELRLKATPRPVVRGHWKTIKSPFLSIKIHLFFHFMTWKSCFLSCFWKWMNFFSCVAVATPDPPTSCWSKPIEFLEAVYLSSNFFTFAGFWGEIITAR